MLDQSGLTSVVESCSRNDFDTAYRTRSLKRLTELAREVTIGSVSFETASEELFIRSAQALIDNGTSPVTLLGRIDAYAATDANQNYLDQSRARALDLCQRITTGNRTLFVLDELANQVIITSVN